MSFNDLLLIVMFPYISSVVHWGEILIRRLAVFADTIMTNPLWI